jgi:Leucine-rich repeat (LRR) protein
MADLVKIIKDLLRSLGLGGFEKAVGVVLSSITMLGSLVGIIIGVGKAWKYLLKSHRDRIMKKDLHPYFTLGDIKKATRYYVPTKYLEVSPSNMPELRSINSKDAKGLVPFFLGQAFREKNIIDADQRFYIILADSGMGKTTFMINLYLKYVCQWFGKKYDIKMLPLGYPDIDMEFDRIEDERKKKTILLLDAFDEDNQAIKNYKRRMDDIVFKTHRFRKVIITCRTQFFPSEAEETNETPIMKFGGDRGCQEFHKFYIAPFDDKDVNNYLNKKFSIFNFKKKRRALEIVGKSPNLMVRPMLLSYIDDLLKNGRQYEYTYEIYEELVNKWIERESKRYKRVERENFKKNMFKFSIDVAVDIYRNREPRKELIINPEEIESFAYRNGIPLENMEMKSRSLLNRNAGGEYKFSHKSILEYILALVACNNGDFEKELSFEGMDEAQRFYSEIIKEKAFELLKNSNGTYRTKENQELTKLSNLEKKEINHIHELYLKDNKISDIRALKVLRGVETLDLKNNRISNISPLGDLKGLKKLWLNHNLIVDISTLKELKNLETLDLENNRISNANPLEVLTGLRKLNLGNNRISGMFFLKLDILGVLDLSNNEITDIYIRSPLNGLDELYLNKNQIKKIELFSDKYNSLRSLKLIDISGNPPLPISQIVYIKGILPSDCIIKSDIHDDFFRLVKIGGIFKTDSEDEKNLKELKPGDLDKITLLSLSYGPSAISLIVKWEILRKNLKHLTLHFDKTISEPPKYTADLGLVYTDEELLNRRINDISDLKELKNLVELNLFEFVPRDISALRELKNLKKLHLDWGEIISDITVLKKLKGLEHLSLRSNAISDISVLKELGRLEIVDVSHNKITDITPLRQLKELRDLNLSYNPISDISPLSELKNLETLDIQGVQINDTRILEELEAKGVKINVKSDY